MFKRLVCIALLVVVSAACSSQNTTGQLPFPVYLPVITALEVPAGPFHSGDSVPLSATWRNGEAPFQVQWIFNGGTDPLGVTHQVDVRTDSVTLTLVNPGPDVITAGGTVQVTDNRGNFVQRAIDLIVEP